MKQPDRMLSRWIASVWAGIGMLLLLMAVTCAAIGSAPPKPTSAAEEGKVSVAADAAVAIPARLPAERASGDLATASRYIDSAPPRVKSSGGALPAELVTHADAARAAFMLPPTGRTLPPSFPGPYQAQAPPA